ncbi:hypothetical protein KUL156_57940 [Alteromonas sp. KUL156]|nr:hypothetical protein KUL154_02990 [Alteromonas sp. KUL154]GFE03202.1 hypothetical protein KUL156_57940 [Alteromonas sp. KUL156]
MKIFQRKDEVAVVRILRLKGDIRFQYTKVLRKEETLELEKNSLFITNSIEDLKKKVKNRPVILMFLGEEVLYSDKETLFKSSANSFYSTSYINNKRKKFLALSRKDVVDSVVDDFLDKEFFLLDVYIGGLLFNLLYKKKSLSKEEEFVGGMFLRFEEGDCKQIGLSSGVKEEANNLTDNDEVLVLSSVLNCFYPFNTVVNTYDKEFINKNKEELKQKTEFDSISKVSIVTLLVVVIISYSIGQFFTFKNSKIETKINQGASKQKAFMFLKEKEKQKKNMLDLSGFYNSQVLSFYINELIKSLPRQVKLSKLDVFPVEKRFNENKKIEINENQILVEGSFEKANYFNEWINELRGVLQIATINITKFKKEKNETDFKLQILLK